MAATTGALLDLRLVGEIAGTFFVARYQRGYRWGALEVQRLLEDIWDSKGAAYCLQPVVVKQRANDAWELIDGQQRLTTLYLIMLFMQREGLQSAGPTYSMTFETRPESEAYLRLPDASGSERNIDFFHFHAAYECIREWFGAHGARRQYVANKFYNYLFESVRVIWYEAPVELDSTKLFTRLNVGRIPLTDAELFKALLLSRSRAAPGRTDRAHELAAQWDSIERDLRNPDIWAFVADSHSDDCPTRITLLLDTVAGGPEGRERPRFHTFDVLRQKVDDSSAEDVWNQVVDLHALVLGWFEARDHYHKVGYLVSTGHRFSDLVQKAAGLTKSSFGATLDALICDSLDLTPSEVTALSYDVDAHREKCSRLLLLMNAETVRRLKNSSERYSFRHHRAGSWSLEHIHAQNAENLTKAEQWAEWLRLHRQALEAVPSITREHRDALFERIDAARQHVNRQIFHDLARDVIAAFTTEAATSIHSVHSVTNLALLSSEDNSALSNAVFEVKRRKILELDRQGAYIPICTRQAFLKYHTGAAAHQVHFWSVQDRESYLNAILSVDRGVGSYLRGEEHGQ